MAVSDHHGDDHLPPWRPQYNTPSPREGFCRVTTSRRDLAAHVIVFGEIRAACLTFKAQQAGCECEALVDVIDLYPFTYYQSRSLTLRGHHQARYLKFVSSSTRDGFNSTPASIKKKKKKTLFGAWIAICSTSDKERWRRSRPTSYTQQEHSSVFSW